MESILQPSASDCCNSGCNPCILDVYEEQLRKFKERSLVIEANQKLNCISQTAYTVFKLTKIVQYARDAFLFTFEYVRGCSDNTSGIKDQLGLFYKPGQHFLIKGQDGGDYFTRAYTPIPTPKDDPLTFTVIAKLYRDGMMSKFLKHLKVGSETLWRGPYGSFEIKYSFRHVLLIGQGTGIAPLYSVIRDYLNNVDCESFVKLFYCCRTEHDILLRNELFDATSVWNFTYEAFLSQPGDVECKYNEKIHRSRLKLDILLEYFRDKLDDDVQVLICGSEIFNQDMLRNVVQCNIDATKVFLF